MKHIFKRTFMKLILVIVIFVSAFPNIKVHAATNYFYPDEEFYMWVAQYVCEKNAIRTYDETYRYFISHGLEDGQAAKMAQVIRNSFEEILDGNPYVLYSRVEAYWTSFNLQSRISLVKLYMQTTGKTGASEGFDDTRVPISGSESPSPDNDLDYFLRYLDIYFKDNISYSTSSSSINFSGTDIDSFKNNYIEPLKALSGSTAPNLTSFLNTAYNNHYVSIVKTVYQTALSTNPGGVLNTYYTYFKIGSSFYTPTSAVLNNSITTSNSSMNFSCYGEYYFKDILGDPRYSLGIYKSSTTENFKGKYLGIEYVYIGPSGFDMPTLTVTDVVNNVFTGNDSIPSPSWEIESPDTGTEPPDDGTIPPGGVICNECKGTTEYYTTENHYHYDYATYKNFYVGVDVDWGTVEYVDYMGYIEDLIIALRQDIDNLGFMLKDTMDTNNGVIGVKLDGLDSKLNSINQNAISIGYMVNDLGVQLGGLGDQLDIVISSLTDAVSAILATSDMVEASTEQTNERIEAVIIMLIIILGLAFIVFILWLCVQLWRLILSHMIQVWF